MPSMRRARRTRARGSNTVSRCDIQQRLLGRQAGEQSAGLAHGAGPSGRTRRPRRARRGRRGRERGAASRSRCPAPGRRARAAARRAPARPARTPRPDHRRGSVPRGAGAAISSTGTSVRQQLGEHPAFAHAARDQLGVLAAEVERRRSPRLRAARRPTGACAGDARSGERLSLPLRACDPRLPRRGGGRGRSRVSH